MCAPVSFGVVSAVVARSARSRKVRWGTARRPRRPRRTPRPPATPPPPGTLPAPLPRNPGQIITTSDTVTVRIGRRAYSPFSGRPTSPPTPPSPGGGATAPCTSSSPEALRRSCCVEIRVGPDTQPRRRRVVVRHGRASCRAVVLAAMSARIAQFARGGVAWVCTARKYRNPLGPRRTRMHALGR